MTHFIPGKGIKEVSTNKGTSAIIRYPKWEDLNGLRDMVNDVSNTDPFASPSYEEISIKEQAESMCDIFKKIEFGDMVFLCCQIGDILVGSCGIDRYKGAMSRCHHIGIFHIVFRQSFRNEGIEQEIAQSTIAEAKKHIKGLKKIDLETNELNTDAVELYKSIGFVETAHLPDLIYYKNNYVPGIGMHMKI